LLREGRTRIVSPGHEEVSVTLAERFLQRIQVPLATVERVLPLVRNHMAHLQVVTDRNVRRLAKRLEPETIQSLCLVMMADAMGRPPRPPAPPPVIAALQSKAAELQVHDSAPKPILMGRHLIEFGLKPGKEFGDILAAAYDAQLEGTFSDLSQACRWLAEQQELPLSEATRAALARRP
jgi:tRNA nucleotidyltransferase (CCA-adding enzyme)